MKYIAEIIFLFLILTTITTAQKLSTTEIVKKIDDTERVISSKSNMKQTVTTSGDEIRTMEVLAYTKNKNEKQLMIYLAPNRVKGDKILMLNEGDEIWFYTPKTDRVRHLASHARKQKVQGSDFSYEDLAGGSIEEDYTYKLLGEEEVNGRDAYKLELIPKPSGPSYKKLFLWADKERFITLKIDYYEEEGLSKTLITSDIEIINNHWYAKTMTMKNILEGGKTVMSTDEIEFDINVDDELFTTQSLKRR